MKILYDQLNNVSQFTLSLVPNLEEYNIGQLNISRKSYF